MKTIEERPYPPKMSKGNPILVIEVSSYAIRIIVTSPTMKLLEDYETKPDKIESALEFIEEQFRDKPGLRVVGSALDNWPPSLEYAIAEKGIPVKWLSPTLMRNAHLCISHWNRKRRLHRARLAAFLSTRMTAQFPDYFEIEGLIKQWERFVAEEILEESR